MCGAAAKAGELNRRVAGSHADRQPAARQLIDRHKEEARGRVLYYYFLYPRNIRFPTTEGQEDDYRAWFKGVANSLVKVGS